MDTQNRSLIEHLIGKQARFAALLLVTLALLLVPGLKAGGMSVIALEPDQTSPMRDFGDAPDAEATPE